MYNVSSFKEYIIFSLITCSFQTVTVDLEALISVFLFLKRENRSTMKKGCNGISNSILKKFTHAL